MADMDQLREQLADGIFVVSSTGASRSGVQMSRMVDQLMAQVRSESAAQQQGSVGQLGSVGCGEDHVGASSRESAGATTRSPDRGA